jgi:cysteine desulfurase
MTAIYLDNAAGTRVHEDVFTAMKPWLTTRYGNPSSIHTFGIEARRAVEEARERTAALIGATPEEIVFTSCGSEANTLAVQGAALSSAARGRHLVISAVEHLSVVKAARTLERAGVEVTVIGADSRGFVDPDAVAEAVRDDTALVSIIHASNEIGTIEPVAEIAKVLRDRGVPLHTDAIQTAGTIPLTVNELGVDLLSLAGNLFYGPTGIAALYVRKGTKLASLVQGGVQERGRRAGTENVAAIVGLGVAAELAARDMVARAEQMTPLRDRLMTGIEERIPRVIISGDRTRRLPGNVHTAVHAVEGESMVYRLAGRGIMAASGSSCADKTLKGSQVLAAIGVEPALINASVLFTLGIDTTSEDIDTVLDELPPIVAKLRAMSPLWDG